MPPQYDQQVTGYGHEHGHAGYRQPGYGQGYPGGPQDYSGGPQGYANGPQGYPGVPQGYPGGPQGYPQRSGFGSGAGYWPGHRMPSRSGSGLATAALWLGILGGWGVINLVIAILAIRETGPGRRPGRTKAVTGLILTFAWAIVWTGIFFAVWNHVGAQAAPVRASTVAASAAAGPGASGDAGCRAAQSAFDTYSANTGSGGLSAIRTLGDALESAAGESKTAAGQLKTAGRDYLALADGSAPPNMVADLEALDEACGTSFDFGG